MKKLIILLLLTTTLNFSAYASAPKEPEVDPNIPVVPVTGYYEIKDPFITNLSSTGNKLNYVKTEVVIVLNDSRDTPLLEEHEALIKNTIVKVLGEATYADTVKEDGQKQITEKCKKAITEITDNVIGRRIIKNVMLTSFMVQ